MYTSALAALKNLDQAVHLTSDHALSLTFTRVTSLLYQRKFGRTLLSLSGNMLMRIGA